MSYGHAERNLAALHQLEAETRELLASLDQPDPERIDRDAPSPGEASEIGGGENADAAAPFLLS